jgi:hypothetical protein
MRTLQGLRADFGRPSVNVLRLASNVADTETIVVGPETFEIEQAATAIGGGAVAAGGDLNNTTSPVQVTITAHGLIVGQLLSCQSEIMRVQYVVDANEVIVSRGEFGTTAATHADGQTILKGNGYTAGRIPIGLISTLTPTAAAPAIVAAINNYSQQRLSAVSISVNEILVSCLSGAAPLASETLAGANNGWTAAQFYGGAGSDRLLRQEVVQRAAVAQDVTLDAMHFYFDFTPTAVLVQIRTAAGALKTWDGAVTISGRRVTVGNGGASDWAATDTVTVIASE